MAYYLTFFCRSGEEDDSSALATFLSKRVIPYWSGPAADYSGVCELATGDGSATPTADWLTLQFSVGTRHIADSVIGASPNDEHGIWGSDLRAELILSGNAADWPLVYRIWAVLITLWSATAWDEMSGFEINKGAPEPA